MQLKRLRDGLVGPSEVTGETASDPISMDSALFFSIQCNVVASTPSAENFDPSDVNVTDDEITILGHGYATGLVGQLTTTTTLPSPLLTATNYYIIVVDEDTVKLATSRANALAGTAIDITTQGTGTHTFTPTTLSGGSVVLQKSNDKINWVNQGSPTSISGSGSLFLEDEFMGYYWARLLYALTAGQLETENVLIIKGEEA